jgi:undecaprenyl-diphosphatase
MNNIIFFNLFSFAHQSVMLDGLIIFFANIFGNILIIASVLFLIFYTNGIFDKRNFSWKYNLESRLKNLAFVFSSAVFAWSVTTILKYIVSSPRPFIVFENIKPLFLHGGMDSFPSGHATFFISLAVSLYMVNKKIGYFYISGALLIGLSRIASGVHFPIDILLGYIIGITVTLIFSLIFQLKIVNRLLAILAKTL